MSTPDVPRDPHEMRDQANEIVRRHQRGLSGYRGKHTPPPVAVPSDQLERLLADGKQALDEGRYADALLRADTAVGMAAPETWELAEAWWLHGTARLRQASPQTARASFSKALKADGGHLPARIGLAEAYSRSGLPERAIPLYLESIPLLSDPAQQGRLRLLLAECYRATGQPDAARRVLRADAGTLDAGGWLRALPTLLLPGDTVGWLLLLIALAAVVVALLQPLPTSGVLLVVVGALLLYLLLQWWRTPTRGRLSRPQK